MLGNDFYFTLLTRAGIARLKSDSEATYKIGKNELDLPMFTFMQIAKATDDFSFNNKLGEGGFGPVYKVLYISCQKHQTKPRQFCSPFQYVIHIYVYLQGMLDKGQEIAVKRLSKTSSQGIDEFMNEVSCIAKLQHRNLVKLLGCCVDEGERMLIYEYMPNKGLDSIIFGMPLTKALMLTLH